MNRRDQFFIMTAVGLATLAPCVWLAGAATAYPDEQNLKLAINKASTDEVQIADVFPGSWRQLKVDCSNQNTQTLTFITGSESQNLNTPRFQLTPETLNLCQEGSKTFTSTDLVELAN